MKRVLYAFAALAVLLQVASCNKSASSGNDVEMAFNVSFTQLPATKVDGVSEAANIDVLDVFVYDAAGTYLANVVPTVTKTDQTHYTVKMRLINNVTYNFVFFAQKSGTYTYAADKKTITINYSAITANSDLADAFYARVNNFTVSSTFSQAVTLTRPFAQINFGSVKTDYLSAEASQVAFDDNLKTAITVKQAATKLNLLTGVASDPADVTFLPGVYMGKASASATLTVNETSFPGATPVRYMGMVYILANPESATTLTKVSLGINGLQNGNAFSSTREVTNVPVRRNYRTQIVGNVFTDEGTFNVTIVPTYETPDYDKNL